jgi:hypothetical protein
MGSSRKFKRPKTRKRLGAFINDNAPDAIGCTVHRTGDLLGVSVSTVWGLIRRREIEVCHFGRRAIVSRASIDALLAKRIAEQRDKPLGRGPRPEGRKPFRGRTRA